MNRPSFLKGQRCSNGNYVFAKALENGLNQLSLCSSKACKGMGYWFHIKCCKIKRTVTFGQVVEQEWKFVDMQVFIKSFFGCLNNFNRIFSSKVIQDVLEDVTLLCFITTKTDNRLVKSLDFGYVLHHCNTKKLVILYIHMMLLNT